MSCLILFFTEPITYRRLNWYYNTNGARILYFIREPTKHILFADKFLLTNYQMLVPTIN